MPKFQIALYEPQIAPNTGNIIRLTANIGCSLHLIGPLGFDLGDKQLRRAGLDYHDLTSVVRHANYEQFLLKVPGRRILACTTKAERYYTEIEYLSDDILLFGSETSGLPDFVHRSLHIDNRIRIPMQASSRSLNLSNAVAIISYEAWRQLGFEGAK